VQRIRNEKVLKAFGENLRKIRKQNGLTQEELAIKSDIAISSIVRIERGQLNTSICTVAKLTTALQVDNSSLLNFCFKKFYHQ